MTKREMFLELLKPFEIGMLTNINESGSLVAHPMARNQNLEDDYLWFFTRRDSEKVQELFKDPRVNVSFSGKDYLSIAGNAEIVEDQHMKETLWTKSNEAFFGTEVTDPNIVLLKIVMDSAEYWKGENQVATAFKFIQGLLTEEEPDIGENEAVEL